MDDYKTPDEHEPESGAEALTPPDAPATDDGEPIDPSLTIEEALEIAPVDAAVEEPLDADDLDAESLLDTVDESPDAEALPDDADLDGEDDEIDEALEHDELPVMSDLGMSFDIDAALAALGTLPDVVAEREAEEAAERAQLAALKADEDERREAARAQAEMQERWQAAGHMARPPLMRAQHSRTLRAAAGLVLIAAGAALTFLFTLEQPYDPLLPGMILGGGVVVLLLVYWLASGRWSRGALFAALTLAALGGLIYWSRESGTDWATVWPLLLAGLGAAAFLTGLLARPLHLATAMTGLAVAFGAAVIYVAGTGLIAPSLVSGVTLIAPYVLIVLAILALLPLILRRRA